MTYVPKQSDYELARTQGFTGSDFELQDELIRRHEQEQAHAKEH